MTATLPTSLSNSSLSKNTLLEDISLFCKKNEKLTASKTQRRILNSCLKQKYTIAVIGESGSGKSSLINAILGRSLLSGDITQCSSELIHIQKGDQISLQIQYASDRLDVIYDKATAIQEALYQNIQVKADLRHLPTTLLDQLLITHKTKKIDVNEQLIAELEKKSGLKLQAYQHKIKDYLEQRKLNQIPLSITLTSPQIPFDHIEFINIPCLNSIAGFNKHYQNICDIADMLIIVHDISTSFQQPYLTHLIEQVSTYYAPDELFLVLTKVSNHSRIEALSRLQEAQKVYGEQVNHIAMVDSIAYHIIQDLNNIDDPVELKTKYEDIINDLQEISLNVFYRIKLEQFKTKDRILANSLIRLQPNAVKNHLKSLCRITELLNHPAFSKESNQENALNALKELLINEQKLNQQSPSGCILDNYFLQQKTTKTALKNLFITKKQTEASYSFLLDLVHSFKKKNVRLLDKYIPLKKVKLADNLMIVKNQIPLLEQRMENNHKSISDYLGQLDKSPLLSALSKELKTTHRSIKSQLFEISNRLTKIRDSHEKFYSGAGILVVASIGIVISLFLSFTLAWAASFASIYLLVFAYLMQSSIRAFLKKGIKNANTIKKQLISISEQLNNNESLLGYFEQDKFNEAFLAEKN